VGPFQLGMTVNHVIYLLRHEFGETASHQFVYHDQVLGRRPKVAFRIVPHLTKKNPNANDLVLCVIDYALYFRFDGASQRLKLIEMRDLAKMRLSYTCFCVSRCMSCLLIPVLEKASFVAPTSRRHVSSLPKFLAPSTRATLIPNAASTF
jgi:hypothetical protein